MATFGECMHPISLCFLTDWLVWAAAVLWWTSGSLHVVSWETSANICISVLIYFILVNPIQVKIIETCMSQESIWMNSFVHHILFQLKLSRNHSIFHFFSGMFLYSSSCSCISLAVSLMSKQRRRCPSPLGFSWVLVAFTTGQFLSVWPDALHYSLLRSEDVSGVVLQCHTLTLCLH